MAAVLRVKRRNDAEPLEALVIACKRRKTENLESEEAVNESITAVLKFAGTVKDQGDNVVEHLKKTLTKEELEANFKQHVVDVASKSRKETKQESKENRFKIVNCFRALQPNDLQETTIDKETTVIDVEDSTSCKIVKSPTNPEDENYVYDLYYTKTGDDMLIDHLVSVHPLQQELVFGSYRDNDARSEGDFESEDSNSESNWRNDYPDSDHSENSICEEDMLSAVKRINLGDDSDLSSDDDDDNENDDLLYALAEEDVENFGYKYAKYKAKIKAEMDGEYASDVCKSASSDSEDNEDRQYEDP